MAHWFDEFHYFSPAEKRGIVLLLGAILIVVVLLVLSPFSSADEPMDPEAEQKFQAEYEAFMASVMKSTVYVTNHVLTSHEPINLGRMNVGPIHHAHISVILYRVKKPLNFISQTLSVNIRKNSMKSWFLT